MIWSVAELLRGAYKQSDHGKVILPFTVLRRFDCVLEPIKLAIPRQLLEPDRAPPPLQLLCDLNPFWAMYIANHRRVPLYELSISLNPEQSSVSGRI